MNIYNEETGEDFFLKRSESLDPRASRLQIHKKKNKSTKWLWNHFRSLVRLLIETDCIPSNIDWIEAIEYGYVRFSIQKTQESTRVILDWYPKNAMQKSHTFLLPRVNGDVSQKINEAINYQQSYRNYTKWPRKQKHERIKKVSMGRNLTKVEEKNVAFIQAVQTVFQTTNGIIPYEKANDYFVSQIKNLQHCISYDIIRLDKEIEPYYQKEIWSKIGSARRNIQNYEYLKWIFQEIRHIWMPSWLYANKRKWLGKISGGLANISRFDKNFPPYLTEISDIFQKILEDANFFYWNQESRKRNKADGVVSMNKRNYENDMSSVLKIEDNGYIDGLEELQDEEYLLSENEADSEDKETEDEMNPSETPEDEYIIEKKTDEKEVKSEIWNKLQFSSGLSEFFDLKKSERNPFMQRISESLLEACTSNSEFMEIVESELGYFQENIPAILEKSETLEDPMVRMVLLYNILHNNAFYSELYNFYQGYSLSRVLERSAHRLSQKIPQFQDIVSLLDRLLYLLDNGNFGNMVGDSSYWSELLDNEERPWDIMLMRFGLIENTVRKEKENRIIDSITYSEVMGCIEEMKQLVRTVIPLDR